MWKGQSELRNYKQTAKQTLCKVIPKARQSPGAQQCGGARQRRDGRRAAGGYCRPAAGCPPPAALVLLAAARPCSRPGAPRRLWILTVCSPYLGRVLVCIWSKDTLLGNAHTQPMLWMSTLIIFATMVHDKQHAILKLRVILLFKNSNRTAALLFW